MIYVVFIVFAVIVIFIININNTKSKEDANKQYFSESIKSYENFNPTYIKYGLDSEYIFAIDEHAKMLLYHRVNTFNDCHMHSISAHYISVHQKFINKQQPC